MATRISPNPVWQLVDQGGDVIVSINNDGSTTIPTGQVGPVASMVNQVKLTLTSAQLKALKATPVSIIPAPGSGKFIQVEECSVYYKFGATAYTLNAGTLKLYHGPVANAKPLTAALETGLIDQTANRSNLDVAILATGNLTDAQALNVDIEVGNAGAAEFTLGDGTVEFFVNYQILQVP